MIQIKVLSSLEKVFPKKEPKILEHPLSFFKNENHSFQIAYSSAIPHDSLKELTVSVHKVPTGVQAKIYEVKLLPSEYPAHADIDDNYLEIAPGLFPDLLKELTKDDTVMLIQDYWKALWVELIPSSEAEIGTHAIEIHLCLEDIIVASCSYVFTIIDAKLPKQELYLTQWFHTDCLCHYYDITPFSTEYWLTVKNYLTTAVEHGMNMVLTPVFTPPLDTDIGGERLTIQLVKVEFKNEHYDFDFTNFAKWVEICHQAGIQYFEISHLFSQWGAKYTPKIIVHTEKGEEKMFGWHTDSFSKEYQTFLQAFLPALVTKIKSLGIEKNCFFHVSDEPLLKDLDSYKKARESILPYIKEFPIIDALSNFEFYSHGIVPCPIPANNHIEPFLEAKVNPLWTYYCTAQNIDVSNRFFSMPSARNRILGYQLFKFNIEGFLHWAYNFWNDRQSRRSIDPYKETDAGLSFPSGDAFMVYPGKNYQAVPSLRLKVFNQGLCDLRAMKMLEQLKSKDFVLQLIDPDNTMTFSHYPYHAEYILTTREKINTEILKYLTK